MSQKDVSYQPQDFEDGIPQFDDWKESYLDQCFAYGKRYTPRATRPSLHEDEDLTLSEVDRIINNILRFEPFVPPKILEYLWLCAQSIKPWQVTYNPDLRYYLVEEDDSTAIELNMENYFRGSSTGYDLDERLEFVLHKDLDEEDIFVSMSERAEYLSAIRPLRLHDLDPSVQESDLWYKSHTRDNEYDESMGWFWFKDRMVTARQGTLVDVEW